MRARFVFTVLVLIVCTGTPAQQQQPIRVNPAPAITPTQPTTPTAPTRPSPTQQQVVVAPVRPIAPNATLLNASQIRAVAVQSRPPAGTTRDEQADLLRVVEGVKQNNHQQAQTDWAFVVERAAKRDKKYQEWIELESWNSYVLHQAYIAPNPELNGAAQKVRFYDEQQRAVDARRAELARAKQDLGVSTTRTVTVRRLALSENYEPNRNGVDTAGTESVSRETIDAEIRKVEEQSRTVGEDAQLANVDLQNKLQQQQQTLQTMSNMSKMFHDTAMSIIRNMKG